MLRCLTATEAMLVLGRGCRPVAEVLPAEAGSPPLLLLPGNGVDPVSPEPEPALLLELPLGSPLFLLVQVIMYQQGEQ